jgi:AraC family transcriptional regulator
MGRLVGDAQLFLWDGGCVFIGSTPGKFPVHAHQAIQISFAADGEIRLRPSEEDPWTSYGVGIIASRQPHAFDATSVSMGVVLFVEPETREGRALTELYLRTGIASVVDPALEPMIAEVFAAFRERRGDTAIVTANRRVVHALTRGVEPSVVSDERIVRAVAYINEHLDGSITLNDVASSAFLSPSRFRHLFVEQTGMGLRPYILWRRFMQVWELIMSGVSLSHAAHQAGFADSAHLSRTSKRMIGAAPSTFRVSDTPASLIASV